MSSRSSDSGSSGGGGNQREWRKAIKQRLQRMRGLGYMYAARTGSERNTGRLKTAVIYASIISVSIFVWTVSFWLAVIPFLIFVLLMAVDALSGVQRFKLEMKQAKAARASSTYFQMCPGGKVKQIPGWAKGSGGSYGYLIGLNARAEDYAMHWPGILNWPAKQQCSLADVVTRVRSSPYVENSGGISKSIVMVEEFVESQIIQFRMQVHKPTKPEDVLELSDQDAMEKTRRLANMAWCAKWGPKNLQYTCVSLMHSVCGSSHGGGGTGEANFWEKKVWELRRTFIPEKYTKKAGRHQKKTKKKTIQRKHEEEEEEGDDDDNNPAASKEEKKGSFETDNCNSSSSNESESD